MFKAFDHIKRSHNSDFFLGKPIFLDACAKCSELPYIICTMLCVGLCVPTTAGPMLSMEDLPRLTKWRKKIIQNVTLYALVQHLDKIIEQTITIQIPFIIL